MSMNKRNHTINGNNDILSKNLNLIQINSSNSNFISKLDELEITIERQHADIVIISEANMNTVNATEMAQRENKFPHYKFFDKTTDNNPVARLTVMVHEEVSVVRAHEYEDDENPFLCL